MSEKTCFILLPYKKLCQDLDWHRERSDSYAPSLRRLVVKLTVKGSGLMENLMRLKLVFPSPFGRIK